MVAKPPHPWGITRKQTKPGDVMIKLKRPGDTPSAVIGYATHSQYVHGGLAVGQGKLVEVNGGLGRDHLRNLRLRADIYVTDLMKDNRGTAYDVWRCNHQDVAEAVAIQAYPFAAASYEKKPLHRALRMFKNYNLAGAVQSAGHPLTNLLNWVPSNNKKTDDAAGVAAYVEANESVLSVANAQKRVFFCTQFVAWMYYQVALKLGFDPPDQFIPIAAKEASPAMLVQALERSSWFSYVGTIQAVHKKSAKF